jgi:hypothetical protein
MSGMNLRRGPSVQRVARGGSQRRELYGRDPAPDRPDTALRQHLVRIVEDRGEMGAPWPAAAGGLSACAWIFPLGCATHRFTAS